MLARANRLVRASDYRNTVRRGRRSSTRNIVIYVFHREDHAGPRFGFIVAKTVGNAVTRNLIRRRLKSVSRSLVDSVAANADIVFRAMPGAQNASWSELMDEVAATVSKEVQG